MKMLFLIYLAVVLCSSCNKVTKNKVLLSEATITFLHNNCVKSIFKIDTPSNSLGVNWSDTTRANPITYLHVVSAGNMKNFPVAGVALMKPYRVKIYEKATGPDVVCDMLDPVTGPAESHDIEFLP